MIYISVKINYLKFFHGKRSGISPANDDLEPQYDLTCVFCVDRTFFDVSYIWLGQIYGIIILCLLHLGLFTFKIQKCEIINYNSCYYCVITSSAVMISDLFFYNQLFITFHTEWHVYVTADMLMQSKNISIEMWLITEGATTSQFW